MVVTIGSVERTTGKDIKMKSILLNDGGLNIAIVTLEKKIQTSSDVNPICLPKNEKEIPTPLETAYMAGWGARVKKDKNLSDQLMKVKMKETKDACKQKYGDAYANKLCLTSSNGDSGGCYGDGGGPIMHESNNIFSIVGVYLYGMCDAQYPELAEHLPVSWIRSQINKDDLCDG